MLSLTIASLGTTSLVNMAKNLAEYAQLAKDWKKLIDDLKDVTDSIPFQVIDSIRSVSKDLFAQGADLATL
jgi:hypothetical protein